MRLPLYIVLFGLLAGAVAWQLYLLRAFPAGDDAAGRGMRALRWVNVALLAIGAIVVAWAAWVKG